MLFAEVVVGVVAEQLVVVVKVMETVLVFALPLVAPEVLLASSFLLLRCAAHA